MKSADGNHTLHSVADGVFAYIASTAGWGWNNAGIIVDNGHGLLVDTLFDMKKTGQMIAVMKDNIPGLEHIDTVINTHGNGDHWFGNGHFKDQIIIASEGAVKDMKEVPPKITHLMMNLAQASLKMGPVGRMLGSILAGLGSQKVGPIMKAAPFLLDCFSAFDFSGIEAVLPNRTFQAELEIQIGDITVQLLDLGPTHTRGDVVVFEPKTGVLFSGDLLFVGAHPILWQGPVENWISACDKMLEWQPKVVVPGHGPLTDTAGIEKQKAYFTFLAEETGKRYEKGMSKKETIDDIDFSRFGDLTEPERVTVNIGTIYRELQNKPPRKSIVPCFPEMAKLKTKLNPLQ